MKRVHSTNQHFADIAERFSVCMVICLLLSLCCFSLKAANCKCDNCVEGVKTKKELVSRAVTHLGFARMSAIQTQSLDRESENFAQCKMLNFSGPNFFAWTQLLNLAQS